MYQYQMQLKGFELFVNSLNGNIHTRNHSHTPKSRNNSHTHSNSMELNNNDFYDTPPHPNLFPHNNIYNSSSFIRSTPSSLETNNNNNNNRQACNLFQKYSPKYRNNNNNNNNNNIYNNDMNIINEMDPIPSQSKSSTMPPGTTNINNINKKKPNKFQLKINTSKINHNSYYNYNNNNNNNTNQSIKPINYINGNGTPTSTASRLSRSCSPKDTYLTDNNRYTVRSIKFNHKPFGFQAKCDKGKITVRHVSKNGQGYREGIQKNWTIIEVNRQTKTRKMVKELQSDTGPYNIIFKMN